MDIVQESEKKCTKNSAIQTQKINFYINSG